jgi:glycosyltransferase involved in cell wall biosynthesis
MNPTPSWRRDLQAAAIHADLGVPPSRGTRLRFLKKLVLRLARVVTHHQVAFNRELLGAVEELIVRADQMERFLAQADADRRHDVASIRSALVEIQQQIVEVRQAPSHDAISRVLPSVDVSVQSPLARNSGPEPHEQSRLGRVPGINVLGDWAATTGLAQAARRLTVALHDAGFDLSLGTVHTGAPLDESRVPSVLRDLPGERSHSIDLWMLNINEFPHIPDEVLRPPGRPKYAIATWYWELPTFPERLIEQMSRVDEIWVATQFVQASFQRTTDRPIHVVPAIVPTLEGLGRSRQDFGLVDDEVVYLFTFDVNSVVARKNPGAVVEAFARAFPSPSATKTRLVIKVLNLDLHPDVDQWLRPLVANVDGVLIAENLGDGELVDLFTCADVYVSLHRSEGFGFGIAEAMALGKPVIATAYSGNVDFATMANSCQVSYRLREITDDDHVFNADSSSVYQSGAEWAEPDLAQATRWMQLLAVDPALRIRIGEAGRATIRERYSARAAVAAVRSRLLQTQALIEDTRIGRLR